MVSIPQSAESTSVNDGANTQASSMPLEIVFLQDTTGSQGPYITAARKAIRDICDKISSTGELSKELIKFGLIAFRDHPPQDMSFVTKNFGFTSDINKMYTNLSSLVASGGGDGPEAQTAALADALNMEWSDKAVKLVILITDAPPHGLGETGDWFTESPDQNDPLEIVRQMAERGITLFVVACEPTLSQCYRNALDFYTALTQITSGRVFPLLMADKLGDYIVGTAIETMDTEKLIGEFEKVIVEDVYTKEIPVEKVAENLQQFMNQKGRKINTIDVEDIYIANETANANCKMWFGATRLSSVRERIQPVPASRIQAQYLPSSSMANPSVLAFGRSTAPLVPASSPAMGRGRGGFGGFEGFARPAHRLAQYSPATPPTLSSPAISPQVQQVSLASQEVSLSQAARIVSQSVARNSKVTAAGMISKSTGQAAITSSDSPK